MNTDDRFQERVEQLEAGASLAACLAGLSEEEAEALRLIAEMLPGEADDQFESIKAAQRAEVLHAAERLMTRPTQKDTQMLPKSWQQGLRGLLGKKQLAGGLAFILIFAILVSTFTGASWWLGRNRPKAQEADKFSGNLPVKAEPSSAVPASPKAVISPTNSTDESVALEPENLASTPGTAIINGLQGLVEIQAANGTWAATTRPVSLSAGQRLRTGALSNVSLAFYDGSSVYLGPESEISIDTLDARQAADGVRTITISQWSGESSHNVASREDESSYTVNTPAGSGTARGTQFQVVLLDDERVQFVVAEGQVDVSNADVSVPVTSGQVSTITSGQPPAQPVLYISGEGEVTQTGAEWIIAGQTFKTDEHTRILGDPQLGDLARVEGYLLSDGTRLAYRIVLLYHAQINRFGFTANVESMGDPTWTIGGQDVVVNTRTQIGSGIGVGNLVQVDGVIIQGGTLLAERIRLVEQEPGLPFQFTGVVQSIGENAWTVSGQAISLNAETSLEAGIAVGDQVVVEGWILEDETWLASAIAHLPEQGAAFDFTGIVQTINPWRVNDIAFDTREWTVVDANVVVGSRVRVSGPILPDGTWVAANIRLLDEQPGQQIEFIGRVGSINPWVVSNISLATNGQTRIEGDIQVNDLVQVKAVAQADGGWLARSIRKLSKPGEQIIITLEGPIQSIDGNTLVINNFTVHVAPEHPLLGQLQVGDTIRVIGRLEANGTVTALVIYTVSGTPPGEVTVRIEGPIDTIDGNLVLVNGIWLWFDLAHPILPQLHIGDFVSVEGYFGDQGGLEVLIVVNITIIEVDVPPQYCYWHEDGMGMGMGMGHWHCEPGAVAPCIWEVDAMGMGHWNCPPAGMGESCSWQIDAMGMGHWHCEPAAMGMGMEDPGMGMEDPGMGTP